MQKMINCQCLFCRLLCFSSFRLFEAISLLHIEISDKKHFFNRITPDNSFPRLSETTGFQGKQIFRHTMKRIRFSMCFIYSLTVFYIKWYTKYNQCSMRFFFIFVKLLKCTWEPFLSNSPNPFACFEIAFINCCYVIINIFDMALKIPA